MTAEEFIDALEQRALLPGTAIAKLRQFVEKSLKIVTPDALAKLLIEKRWLTSTQAEQLLRGGEKIAAAGNADLALAPLDDIPTKRSALPAQKAAAKGASVARDAKSAPESKSKGAAANKDFGLPLTGPGSLDDLLGESSRDESPTGARANRLMRAARRRSAVRKTAWIAGAGGSLLLLVIVAVGIAIGRGNGDAEWQLAERDFSAGSDQDAIDKLDGFLKRYPNHPRSGTALVFRGMARLRRATASKTDWDQPLTIAQEVLPKIVEQPDFMKVREALGKILPEMAAGLAKQARDRAKGPLGQLRRQVEAAVQGLALAKDPRYTPDSRKPWSLLQTIENEIAILLRTVDRETQLSDAAGQIRSAIAAGHLATAVTRRDRLCDDFPELREDARIERLDQELAHGEAKLIQVDAERRKAETKPRPTSVISTIGPASRDDKRPGAASDRGSAAAVFAEGTAYWLNAADGAPLAREFIGFDSSLPLAIESSGGTDFIVYDAEHQELARVAARSAATVWRQPLGGAMMASPVIAGGRLFAATRSGRLVMLDVESGDVLRSAQLAEPLRAPPAISADGTTIYLASDRGNLFVFTVKDFHCTGAEHLGYEPGTVTLAPILFGKYVALVESHDFENSVLRLLTVEDTGVAIKTVQQIPFAGHVTSTPIVDAGRLYVATNRGAMVFADNGQTSAPLAKGAELPAADGPWKPHFLAVQGSSIWLCGDGVAHFDLAAADGVPRPVWERFAGDRVVQPPTLVGNRLIVAGRRSGAAGVWVTALDAQSGQPIWETALASPLAKMSP